MFRRRILNCDWSFYYNYSHSQRDILWIFGAIWTATAVQSDKRQQAGLHFDIYLWILWQTRAVTVRYPILIFFLQSVQRKKTVTDLVKTQSGQINFSLTAFFHLPSAVCTETKDSSWNAAWTGESYIFRQRLDLGRLQTFSFLGNGPERDSLSSSRGLRFLSVPL